MKKFAMLAVVFAFTMSVIGCGPAPTTKGTVTTVATTTATSTTPTK